MWGNINSKRNHVIESQSVVKRYCSANRPKFTWQPLKQEKNTFPGSIYYVDKLTIFIANIAYSEILYKTSSKWPNPAVPFFFKKKSSNL